MCVCGSVDENQLEFVDTIYTGLIDSRFSTTCACVNCTQPSHYPSAQTILWESRLEWTRDVPIDVAIWINNSAKYWSIFTQIINFVDSQSMLWVLAISSTERLCRRFKSLGENWINSSRLVVPTTKPHLILFEWSIKDVYSKIVVEQP